MRFFTARLVTLAAFVPALLLFVVVPGCAKQSEGERCGDEISPSNNDDCDDGLVCTEAGSLLNSNGAHRCCYADKTRVTDSRCEPKGSGTAGGGTVDGSTEQAGASSGSN